MKVRVISDRQPWIGGAPRIAGFEADVSAAEGKAMIDAGLAEEVKVAPKAKAKKGDDE